MGSSSPSYESLDGLESTIGNPSSLGNRLPNTGICEDFFWLGLVVGASVVLFVYV